MCPIYGVYASIHTFITCFILFSTLSLIEPNAYVTRKSSARTKRAVAVFRFRLKEQRYKIETVPLRLTVRVPSFAGLGLRGRGEARRAPEPARTRPWTRHVSVFSRNDTSRMHKPMARFRARFFTDVHAMLTSILAIFNSTEHTPPRCRQISRIIAAASPRRSGRPRWGRTRGDRRSQAARRTPRARWSAQLLG